MNDPVIARPPRRAPRLLRYGAALLLGAVIGSSVTVVLGVGLVKHWVRTQNDWPHRAAARTARALSLDAGERDRVERVFEERFGAISGIRREMYPRLSAELDLMESQVAEALPPEKAGRWRELFGRMRDTFVAPPPTK